MDNAALLQESEYSFPYHHLVSFEPYKNSKSLYWGLEYYGYMMAVIGELINLQPNRLLDVGCGEGKLLIELRKFLPSSEMVGIDSSDRAIAYAKAFGFDQGIDFKRTDLKDLDGSYDAIILTEVLEHIPEGEIADLAKNLYRLLNDDGRILITVPSTVVPIIKKHLRHYTIEVITQQLPIFSVASVKYLIRDGFCYRWLIRTSNKFDRFELIRKFCLKIAKTHLFPANFSNGRHILCILTKTVKN